MGIRRRRKKLTTIINSVDRRLRSVEYRSIPTKLKPASVTPTDIVPGTIPSADPKDNGGTGATSSDTSPSEFAIITTASYSARNITGTVDRVDITTATDHGLSVGDKVTVYGLNNNDVNLDGTYVITEVPTSTTLRFSRGLTGYYQSTISLAVQATVTNRYSSTTTGTLTLNSTSHGFVVGDVITVSGVPDDTFFNGTFKVSAVSGADVSYNFPTAQTSVSITASTGYVKSVLHKYAIIGDTWIDTSVTPNTIKVWDGLQWVSGASLPDGVIIDDHMAPNPPTNLSTILSGYYNPTTGEPKVAATLAWDAPTQNADGSTLTDLAGYRVFYRYKAVDTNNDPTGAVGYEPPGQTTTPGSPASSDATVSGTFSWNNTFTSSTPAIELVATGGTLNKTVFVATKGKKSTNWTITGLADGDAFTIEWKSSSANKYGSGTISGTIGSTTYTTTNIPATSGFSISGTLKITSQTKSSVSATPDITTDIPSTSEVSPEAQWISAGDTDQTNISMRDFNVASTIEFAVQAYDSSTMNFSVYSDILAVDTGSPAIILAAPSTPTMEARLGTLTIKWDGFDEDGVVPPPYLAFTEVHLGTTSGFTPSISTLKGRMERLGYNELVVANLTYGTTYYAKLIFVSTTGAATQASNASTGVSVVALVNTDIIGQVINGAKITPGTIDAAESIVGLSITGDLIQGNTIRGDSILANDITADQIRAGALDAFLITGSNIQTAASGGRITINSGGITAYAANGTTETFKINSSDGAVTIGGYLPAGGAAADINAGTTTINGSKITTGTISASDITTGTLTGRTVQSAASGSRVSLSGSTNSLNFYDSSGNIYSSLVPYSGSRGTVLQYGSDPSTISAPRLGITSGTVNLVADDALCYVQVSPNTGMSVNGTNGNFSAVKVRSINQLSADNTIVVGTGASSSYIYGYTTGAWFRTANDGSTPEPTYFQTSSSYNRTYAQTANMYVTTNGVLGRATSASKYKLLIEEKVGFDFYKILELKPKSWFDKGAVEQEARVLTALYNGETMPEQVDKEPLERVSGLIAEDLIAVGLEDYVQWGPYKEDGTREVEGIHYATLWTCLIPIVKELRDRINQLESN